jgi:predicted RNA polymerase sigma factor
VRVNRAVSLATVRGPSAGLATTEVADSVPGQYPAASAKVVGRARHRECGSHVRSVYERMARMSIEPRWARYSGFGAGRVPAFVLRLGQP